MTAGKLRAFPRGTFSLDVHLSHFFWSLNINEMLKMLILCAPVRISLAIQIIVINHLLPYLTKVHVTVTVMLAKLTSDTSIILYALLLLPTGKPHEVVLPNYSRY